MPRSNSIDFDPDIELMEAVCLLDQMEAIINIVLDGGGDAHTDQMALQGVLTIVATAHCKLVQIGDEMEKAFSRHSGNSKAKESGHKNSDKVANLS